MEKLIIDSQELKEIIFDSFFIKGLNHFNLDIDRIQSSGLRDEFELYLKGDEEDIEDFISYYHGEIDLS